MYEFIEAEMPRLARVLMAERHRQAERDRLGQLLRREQKASRR